MVASNRLFEFGLGLATSAIVANTRRIRLLIGLEADVFCLSFSSVSTIFALDIFVVFTIHIHKRSHNCKAPKMSTACVPELLIY